MKKILLYILLVVSTVCFVGCSANKTSNLAKDLDATIKNFVVAVSNLDWPEDSSLDKLDGLNTNYENNTTADDSSAQLDTGIDTSEIYSWLDTLHSKINVMLSKRADLLLFINEIHGGNTNLSEADQLSLKIYMNILKDNSNYLSSYKGMLKNQISEAENLYNNNSNINAINAYIIKAVETLQVRSAKIDTSILAMNSIIDIISSNLVNNYFKYKEHTIAEIKEDTNADNINNGEQSPKQETPNQDTNQDEATEPDTQPNIQDNPDTNNTTTDDSQNAIDFDGNAVEVDKDVDTNLEDASSTKNQKTDTEKVPESKETTKTTSTASEIITNENNNTHQQNKDKKISRETIREKII